MRTWYNAAKTLAFGELRLKPWEFDRLSVFEFNDMVDACNEIRMAKRWKRPTGWLTSFPRISASLPKQVH